MPFGRHSPKIIDVGPQIMGVETGGTDIPSILAIESDVTLAAGKVVKSRGGKQGGRYEAENFLPNIPRKMAYSQKKHARVLTPRGDHQMHWARHLRWHSGNAVDGKPGRRNLLPQLKPSA